MPRCPPRAKPVASRYLSSAPSSVNKDQSKGRGWPQPRPGWFFRTFLLVSCSHFPRAPRLAPGRDAAERVGEQDVIRGVPQAEVEQLVVEDGLVRREVVRVHEAVVLPSVHPGRDPQ